MGASKSFSTRLSLNILLIVSILFIIALGVVAVSSHILIAEEATKSANNTLKASLANVTSKLQTVETATRNAAWVAQEHLDDEAALYDITKKIVENNPEIIGSTIAFDSNYHQNQYYFAPYSCINFENDEIISFQLGTDSNNYFTQEWFYTPQQTGEPHWSEPYFDTGGAKKLMSTYSYPIKDKQGNTIAIITADISLEWLAQEAETIHPYEHSYAIFASAKGNYLATGLSGDTTRNLFEKAKSLNDEKATLLAENMVNGKSGSLIFHNKKQTGFAVYGPLPNGWSAVVISQYRDVLQRTSQMHLVLFLVGLLGLLIMFIICYRTIQHLTQPLTEFSVSALNMAKGNFHAQLPEIKTKDEMLRLHDSFAYMQKTINTYIAELRSTTSANERMESELNIARNIQAAMLPKNFPNSKHSSLYALLTPAKEVGGDFYDFYEKDNMLYFSVGDVSGKGVPAALVMAITRAAHHFFSTMNLPMRQIASRLNQSIAEGNEYNMFVTLFTGRIDLTTGKMQYCNAGHNPIIVIPPDLNEKPYFLKAIPNLAIGLFSDFDYQDEELELAEGTRLLIYTDGVSEAETAQKELFGDDRLLAAASTNEFRKMGSTEMVNSIYASIKEFTSDNEQNDDITIMAVIIKNHHLIIEKQS